MVLPQPQQAARDAGLRYVTDQHPGIRRIRRGKGFRYLTAAGKPLRNRAVIDRVSALAIPPAWRDVWICPHVHGHLQATGLDARGRKQYRYHADWTAARNLGKFDSMSHFGAALPAIRRRIAADLKQHGMPREKVLACIVQLLDRTLIRIGNDEYARDNKSFGLTTIRNTHARVNGSAVRFNFRGKGGKDLEVSIDDPRVAKIVRRCQDLPGQELFAYVSDDGEHRDVGSSDVNAYLAEIGGEQFTAKDFRTWGGTVSAAEFLYKAGRPAPAKKPRSPNALKRLCNDAIKCAADTLQNTATVCRKFYVHPRLFDLYASGQLHQAFARAARTRRPARMNGCERAVLQMFRAAGLVSKRKSKK